MFPRRSGEVQPMHPTSVILRLVLVLLAFIAAASALPYGRGLNQLILNNQPRPQPSPATGDGCKFADLKPKNGCPANCARCLGGDFCIQCASGYYNDFPSEYCVPCDETCRQCLSPNLCSCCKPGFAMDSGGRCVATTLPPLPAPQSGPTGLVPLNLPDAPQPYQPEEAPSHPEPEPTAGNPFSFEPEGPPPSEFAPYPYMFEGPIPAASPRILSPHSFEVPEPSEPSFAPEPEVAAPEPEVAAPEPEAASPQPSRPSKKCCKRITGRFIFNTIVNYHCKVNGCELCYFDQENNTMTCKEHTDGLQTFGADLTTLQLLRDEGVTPEGPVPASD